ncbi:MAG: crossover junction endodeoxyribonuclease RuvC [Candidatus Eremiobacteraeota bacterium]|nr:crossover junction endodeoxyribonuclease RuvC [Candidatus Eremiobacteraeota bacterium]
MTEGAILGIDPGTRKCGYAVVAVPGGDALELGIVAPEALAERIASLLERLPIRSVALGGGTHTAAVAAVVARLGLPLRVVDERETTLLARRRYFEVNPPRGWRRLIPRGMLLPPRPIDDFAALLIAERLLEEEARAKAAGETA